MAISPINLARVSQNLRTGFVADSVRRSQLELFRAQTLIATGRSFVTPSENPQAAAQVLDLTQVEAIPVERRRTEGVTYIPVALGPGEGRILALGKNASKHTRAQVAKTLGPDVYGGAPIRQPAPARESPPDLPAP